jgi:hypothetical protein
VRSNGETRLPCQRISLSESLIGDGHERYWQLVFGSTPVSAALGVLDRAAGRVLRPHETPPPVTQPSSSEKASRRLPSLISRMAASCGPLPDLYLKPLRPCTPIPQQLSSQMKPWHV